MCYLSSKLLSCAFYTILKLPGRLFRRDLKSETVGARAAVHAPGTLWVELNAGCEGPLRTHCDFFELVLGGGSMVA